MKKILIITLLAVIRIAAFSQAPTYAPLGSKLGNNIIVVNPIKGQGTPRYCDTTYALVGVYDTLGLVILDTCAQPNIFYQRQRTAGGTHYWQAIGSGGGGSETWQQTLINGSSISQDNTITGNNHDFLYDEGSRFRFRLNGDNLGLDIASSALRLGYGLGGAPTDYEGLYVDPTNGLYNLGSGGVFGNSNGIFINDVAQTTTIVGNSFIELTSGGGAILDINSSGLFAFQSSTGSYQYSNLQTNANPTYVATWNSNVLGQTLLSDIISPVSSSGNVFYVEDSTNTQPVSPSDSTYWLTGGSPTGSDPTWTGNANKVLLWDGAAWSVPTQASGDYAVTLDDNITHKYNGTTWPIVSAIPWTTNGNFGGGILGSTNASQVYLRYNNNNRIILGGSNAVRFTTMTGASDGLMGLSPTGVGSNVQIGSGLMLSGGTLSATGSGGTVTSVGLSMPTGFSVTGSPVTTSGTLAVTTSLNGIIKGDGSGFGTVTIGSGLSYDGTTLSASASAPGLQTVITTDPALTVDNTITFTSKTLTWSGARWNVNLADSGKIATTNSFSISSLAGLNLWSVGTLTERGTSITSSGTTLSYHGSFTGISDSLGYFTQQSGGRAGDYILGLAYSSATPNRVLLIDTTTKKVSWSTFDASTLTNYFTRYSSTNSMVYLTNLSDSLAIGTSFRGDAKFVVNGTSKLSSNIAMGAAGVSTLMGVQSQYTINSANSYGISSTLISSDVSAAPHAGIRGIMTAGGNSTALNVAYYGAYYQVGNTNAGSNTTGLLAGNYSNITLSGSGKMSYGRGFDAQLVFGTNNSAIHGDYTGYYSENISNLSAATDSVQYFHHFFADSVPSTLVSRYIWGFYQKGTNATNFFAGKTRIGYGSAGDTIATTTLQIGGGFAARATVSSAGTLTLDNTSTSWVFSGTTTTWTLPTIATSSSWIYYIKNRGSGAITLNTNAGGNEIYTTSAVSSLTINAGEGYIIQNDGTYFSVLSKY